MEGRPGPWRPGPWRLPGPSGAEYQPRGVHVEPPATLPETEQGQGTRAIRIDSTESPRGPPAPHGICILSHPGSGEAETPRKGRAGVACVESLLGLPEAHIQADRHPVLKAQVGFRLGAQPVRQPSPVLHCRGECQILAAARGKAAEVGPRAWETWSTLREVGSPAVPPRLPRERHHPHVSHQALWHCPNKTKPCPVPSALTAPAARCICSASGPTEAGQGIPLSCPLQPTKFLWSSPSACLAQTGRGQACRWLSPGSSLPEPCSV